MSSESLTQSHRAVKVRQVSPKPLKFSKPADPHGSPKALTGATPAALFEDVPAAHVFATRRYGLFFLTHTAMERRLVNSLLAGKEAENENEDNDASNRTGQYR